jgi:hypothetical protein
MWSWSGTEKVVKSRVSIVIEVCRGVLRTSILEEVGEVRYGEWEGGRKYLCHQ